MQRARERLAYKEDKTAGRRLEDSCMKMTNIYKEKGAAIDEKHQLNTNEMMEHFEQDKTSF